MHKRAKSGISMSSERCHGSIYFLNKKDVLDFESKDIYLLFAILSASQYQNFYFLPKHEAKIRP